MATVTQPLVDVIIPVHNGQDYVQAAINSVTHQTLKPRRIIVVDDGSTDRTAKVVQSLQAPVAIQYIHKSHGGLSAARNTGIEASTSTYVAFLDADDEWQPSKLAEQLAVFKQTTFQNLGAVYCQYSIIDAAGHPTNAYYIFHIDPTVRGQVFERILAQNKIASSASGIVIKRECFAQIDLFDEQLQAFEDWDFWLRLAQRYEFDYVDQPLVKIRRHGGNMQRDSVMMFTNRLKFYNKWIGELSDSNKVPRGWAQVLLTEILARLPHRDFLQLTKQYLSLGTRQEFQQIITHSLKMYTAWRLLMLPFTFIRNIFRSATPPKL